MRCLNYHNIKLDMCSVLCTPTGSLTRQSFKSDCDAIAIEQANERSDAIAITAGQHTRGQM